MADQNIGCRLRFCGIGESGIIGFARVLSPRPTVRLNTDGDVDLRDFQGTADIADLIVVCRFAFNHCFRRRNNADTCIETSLAARRIIVAVAETN